MCRFFPCVIFIMFCLVFNSYMASCSLTCPYAKACWKGENSHGRPQKFFQGSGQRHYITRLCFFGCWRCNANGRSQNALLFLHHKKMPRETTRLIRIYFETFFKWSCIRVYHKAVLSVIRYSILLNWCINLIINVNSTMGAGRGERHPGFWKFHQKRLFS